MWMVLPSHLATSSDTGHLSSNGIWYLHRNQRMLPGQQELLGSHGWKLLKKEFYLCHYARITTAAAELTVVGHQVWKLLYFSTCRAAATSSITPSEKLVITLAWLVSIGNEYQWIIVISNFVRHRHSFVAGALQYEASSQPVKWLSDARMVCSSLRISKAMGLLLESCIYERCFFSFETFWNCTPAIILQTPSDTHKLFGFLKGNTTDVLPPCHRRSSRPGHRTFG